jgi:hypothetical protein
MTSAALSRRDAGKKESHGTAPIVVGTRAPARDQTT